MRGGGGRVGTAAGMGRRAFLARVAAGGGVLLAGPGWGVPADTRTGLRADDDPRDILADLRREVPGLLEQNRVPGCAVALLRRGKVEWAGGFGRRVAGKDAVDEHTVFEAASLSKPVFGYVVLQLCQEKVLELDTPLVRYLPPRYLDDPQADLITARQVLSHTSGLPNWRRSKPLAFRFPPGSRFGYSGEGYHYLQKVVEHVTGKPLDTVMGERLFEPMGLRESSYRWQPRFAPVAAAGHDKEGRPQPHMDERFIPFQKPGIENPEVATPVHNAASSLYTSISDFARVMANIMRPARKRGHLPEGWLRAMLTPQVRVDEALSRGLGWALETTALGTAFCHGGNNHYVLNFALGYRDLGFGAVCFTNGQNGKAVYEKVFALAVGGEHPAVAAG